MVGSELNYIVCRVLLRAGVLAYLGTASASATGGGGVGLEQAEGYREVLEVLCQKECSVEVV